jgi:FolB domain-containing protein
LLKPNVVRICIEDLLVQAYLGVHQSEQEQPRSVPVYVEFDYECPASDKLSEAVDYRHVRDKVLAAVENRRFALVEIMAKTILDALKSESRISRALVKVSKTKALKQAKAVSALLEWQREKQTQELSVTAK